MYLTYEEYLKMGGTLSETAFTNLEIEAEFLINWHTFNRLKSDILYPKAVKVCVFKLVEIVSKKQEAFSLGQSVDGKVTSSISSQSNDGVSISYNAMSASELFSLCKDEMRQTIQMYLSDVKNSKGHKLLYRGIYKNE